MGITKKTGRLSAVRGAAKTYQFETINCIGTQDAAGEIVIFSRLHILLSSGWVASCVTGSTDTRTGQDYTSTFIPICYRREIEEKCT